MYKTDTDYPRLGPTLMGYMLPHNGKGRGM